MARDSHVTLIVMALLAAVAGAADAQTCEGYSVLKSGPTPAVVSGSHTTTLPATQIGGPWSISPTTVPGYEDWGFNFVTQDDKIYVIHYGSTTVPQTLNLKADSGLPGTVLLYDAVAAQPVHVDGTVDQQALLYVVGLHATTIPEPYFWVLDQRAIFKRHEDQSSAPYIVHHGKLCQTGQNCSGVAGEVQVFSRNGQANKQVVYVQTLEFTVNPVEQRIMKITRNGSPTNFQVTIAQDLAPRATDFPNLGFAFDRVTGTPYAAVAGTVMNLDNAEENCQLGTYVTDLAIVDFDPLIYPEYQNKSYTFATVQLGTTSKLIGFPTGQCPDSVGVDLKIDEPVPHKAIKLHMQKLTYKEGVMRVLSSNGTVTEFAIDITHDASGDKIDAAVIGTSTHAGTAVDFALKPTNLCLCEEPEDDQCLDSCFITEGGEIACDGIGPYTDPPPVRCLDPQDPGCDNTPVCKTCWD